MFMCVLFIVCLIRYVLFLVYLCVIFVFGISRFGVFVYFILVWFLLFIFFDGVECSVKVFLSVVCMVLW